MLGKLYRSSHSVLPVHTSPAGTSSFPPAADSEVLLPELSRPIFPSISKISLVSPTGRFSRAASSHSESVAASALFASFLVLYPLRLVSVLQLGQLHSDVLSREPKRTLWSRLLGGSRRLSQYTAQLGWVLTFPRKIFESHLKVTFKLLP